MEILIVTGFFGAGKTSFIQQYLKKSDEKVAILVNEFGDISIDGEIIRKGDLEVVELPGGCVCCTLRASIPDTVDRIHEDFAPDLLIIEPSGVATPGNVLSAIENCRYRENYRIRPVICLIDAVSFTEYLEEFGKFYRDQIETADIILINKTDLVDEHKLDEIERELDKINPEALTVRTIYGRFHPPGGEHKNKTEDRDFDIHFDSVSVYPEKRFTLDELKKLLNRIVGGEFGRIIRGKGFVRCETYYKFQISGNEYEVERWKETTPRAVFIGSDLNPEDIVNLFKN